MPEAKSIQLTGFKRTVPQMSDDELDDPAVVMPQTTIHVNSVNAEGKCTSTTIPV